MKTFLRSLFICTPSRNSTRSLTLECLPLRRCCRRILLVSLLLFTLITSTNAQALRLDGSKGLITHAAVSTSRRTERKRLVTLRRNEMLEGSRFTLMSDAPLTDYRSFAEGERICVLIPQAAFVSTRGNESGHGFVDMRIEQRDENVMFSFRLQQGATVAVNQSFNRLEVIFMTNERANSVKTN